MTNIREKLDVVGKLEVLQSMLDESHSSNGIIKKYIAAYKFRSDIDTRSLTANMLREFKVYDWMNTINEFCEVVIKEMNENVVALTLESTLFSLTQQNRFNSYNGAIEILEGLTKEEDLTSDKIFVALKESTWIPAIKNLFSIVESTTNAPVTANSDVTVSKVYSPIDIVNEGEENESYLFHANGRLYENCGNEIKTSTVQPSVMFGKLLAVCEAFNIEDNKMKMTHKSHTIEIVLGESVETFIDGKLVEADNVSRTLSNTGSFYVNEMNKLELIDFASKNADKIQEMDMATNINSRVYEGVTSNIFKVGDSIFVNNINRSMMSNELTKAEDGNAAVSMVKEFVNYDASNILKDVLADEEKFATQIAESKTLIEERISFLNEQLGEIMTVENQIGTSDDLNKAKTIIQESLDEEQATLSNLLIR